VAFFRLVLCCPVASSEPGPTENAFGDFRVAGLDNAERRISLLVNQTRSIGEARVVHDRISKVAKQFLGVPVLDAGHMPADEQVSLAVRRRTPFVIGAPRCAASFAVSQLAMRLEQGVGHQLDTGGFFHRMSRWFRK